MYSVPTQSLPIDMGVLLHKYTGYKYYVLQLQNVSVERYFVSRFLMHCTCLPILLFPMELHKLC